MSVLGVLPAIVFLSGVGLNPLPFVIFAGTNVFIGLF